MAMTADGKIATANRRVSSFGSPQDKAHLLELRATADAVMAGARTAEAPGVTLGPGGSRYRRMRLASGLPAFNLRVIVSGSGSINLRSGVFRRRFSPIIVLTTKAAGTAKLGQLRKAADDVHVCGRKEIDFASALKWLRQKWNVKRLLCEGGGELNEALFRANLVDELHLTVCPRIFGGRTAPTIADGIGAETLSGATRLRLHHFRRVGDEMFLVYRRQAAALA